MKPPDIVLLMTDQQRFDQVSYASSGTFETPHLDALARAGVIFETAYSSSTVCVPARVSLLTGLLHHRVPTQINRLALREGFWTLPHALQAAGYETALFGKAHFFPMYAAHGFEKMTLCEHLTGGYGPNDRDDYSRWFESQKLELDPVGDERLAKRLLNALPFPYEERYHPTHWVVRETMDFLEHRDSRRPLLLVVSFPHPHAPHDPPDPYASMYDSSQALLPADGFGANEQLPLVIQAIRTMMAGPTHVPRRVDATPVEVVRRILTYTRALVKQIDDAVGRLMTVIDLDDTLVFFTSDHGDYAGHRGLLGKVPWISFDDLVRVPFFCVGRGVQGGRRGSALVQSFDFAATALDYAGLDGSGYDLDGRSLRQYLEGTLSDLDPDRAVFSATTMGWPAVRRRGLKYVKSNRFRAGMLFDLERDPGETLDVSAQETYDREGAQLQALLARCLEKPVPDLPRFG